MTKQTRQTGSTQQLSEYLDSERRRIMNHVSPQRWEQMRAAEDVHKVYHAWNKVCANTREGRHVTGLRYLPETNRLLVYLDGDVWVTEMTVMREILRARLERCGVALDGFLFRASAPGYHAAVSACRKTPQPSVSSKLHRKMLSLQEDKQLSEAVAPIENEQLREALKNAIKASLETKKP